MGEYNRKVEIMLVMVVDDDEGILTMIEMMLKRRRIDSIKCIDGREFYRKLRELYKKNQLPDLVLLDVMLPDISGHEVLATLKKYKGTKKIPVVIITAAYARFIDLQKKEPIEYEGILTKPFHQEELLEAVYKATAP